MPHTLPVREMDNITDNVKADLMVHLILTAEFMPELETHPNKILVCGMTLARDFK